MVRLGAYIVDQIALALLGLAVGSIVISAIFPDVAASDQNLTLAQRSVLAGIGTCINLLYYTISVGLWGRTIGKRVFGLVILKSDGSRVGYARAFFRAIGYYVDFLTLGAGFLMIAWNKKRQGLHDMLVDTIVIKRSVE
jgi:uncharacterized RDD family membrane protein YckC